MPISNCDGAESCKIVRVVVCPTYRFRSAVRVAVGAGLPCPCQRNAASLSLQGVDPMPATAARLLTVEEKEALLAIGSLGPGAAVDVYALAGLVSAGMVQVNKDRHAV